MISLDPWVKKAKASITQLNIVWFMMVSDSEGRTPLHWAVDRGHLNAVEILVNANADVNTQVSVFCGCLFFLCFNHCILEFSCS